MRVELKPLKEQTIVITGASSGIGLATARLAASRGARVVLAARNGEALQKIVDEIEDHEGEAIYVTADVADPDQVDAIAAQAISEFGGFDTWVNGASVGIYGRLHEIPLEDKRRMFDVTFWGVVHGCRSALPHLRSRGGALINIGSITSDRSLPLLGIYAAAKHAVKGYTDALRMELEEAEAPVAVTLIKPASIDTPFFRHARNYMDAMAKPAPPVYSPHVVAKTILHCAEHPTRDVVVGGGGRMITAMGSMMPRITDRYMEATQFSGQKDREMPIPRESDSLYDAPPDDGDERGEYRGHVMRSSAYTAAKIHPRTARLLLAAGVGAAAAMRWMRER